MARRIALSGVHVRRTGCRSWGTVRPPCASFLVFPTPACIADVLQRLNDKDLAHLWKEDETIGWIYQYFNDRRKSVRRRCVMFRRSPRNTRELAVRNQFFTPRYVVEFLTDNTLGRIWYEMQQGETSLKDECRIWSVAQTKSSSTLTSSHPKPNLPLQELSQEELLNDPSIFYTEPRKTHVT